MKPRKKNKFFTFIFSLLPGAGEMYMGFMKTGLSLMILFVSVIAVAGYLQIPVLILFLGVIWCYGFFHVHHLRSLNDDEFLMMEDNYLFGLEILSQGNKHVEKYRNWFAYVLIGLGVALLWQLFIGILIYIGLPTWIYNIVRLMESGVPKLVVGVLVIIVGIRLIKGKKAILFSDKQEEQKDSEQTESVQTEPEQMESEQTDSKQMDS